MKRFLLLWISFIVFLTALLLHAAKAADPADHGATLQEIFILNSYHPGYAFSDDEQTGIIDVFRAKAKNWIPIIEYLDLKRLPDGRHLAELKKLFRLKYQNRKFSVVIAMDNPALEFAVDNQAGLFGNAPIVFCGINNYTPSLLKGRSDVTGIAEAIDIAGTIEVMLRQHPATQEIFSPHDYTATGLAVRKELEALAPRFGQVRFRFTDPMTMEELLKEIEKLPKDSLILEIGFIIDKSGRTFGISETSQLFSEHSPVPIYSTYEQRLGFGIVGGKLLSPRIHGANAARFALRVLAGEKASAIPVVFESDSQFMFDYKVMNRFGIPLSALPENSTVINKPISFYAANRVDIHTVLGIIIFMATVIFLLTINIIQKRRSAILLQESENKFKNFAEQSLVGIYLIQDGVFKYVNPKFAEIFGYTDKNCLDNLHFRELVYPEDYDTVEEQVRRRLSGEKQFVNYAFRGIKKTGEIIHVEIFGSTTSYEGKPAAIGTLLDITERNRTELSLRDSEEKFSRAFDSAPLLMTISSVEDGVYLNVNREFTKVSGFKKEEAVGKTSVELGWIKPKSREILLHGLKKKGSFKGMDLELETKDGRKIICSYYGELVNVGGRQQLLSIAQDVTIHRRAEEELRNSLVELEDSKTATLNLLDDLTKETEERLKLEERLHLAEKMESLGLLAGGVAHDLNNILGALSVYTELLLEKIPDGSSLKEYVDNILLSSKKGAEIVQDMLIFSKSGMFEYRVININSMISGFFNSPVFQKLQNSYPDIVFRKELSPQLLNIKGSSVHLEKTVMNLLLNAAEAVSGSGEVEIRTENRLIETPVQGYDKITEGEYAVVTVSDTGVGISAADIRRIFEPFFTRKVMGRKRGTGLGLPIVWGTVKDHNGYIDVFSETGKGSSFTLYFPVTREEPAEDNLKIPVENYMGRGELILVIDDMAEQRDIAKKMLTKLRYQVHVISSGEEAVEYLKTHKADLLILDMIMEPGIDGLETYERILKINPKQRAIIASGFFKTERIMKALDLGAGSYIKKPYLIENIGVAIRDELQKRREGIFQNGKNSNH